ncbi:Gamma-glutamyltranspeptidase 1 [Trichinella nativa]|uniref:Gamma-glutamyltranspeptidase 1 n=1 Tax=Trichinella nativa TaxID=6335 RepID=A0A0V1LLH4_9BILA|nr:Gamma-glutamyltranspeptidase 1 [Trichinella nativa]
MVLHQEQKYNTNVSSFKQRKFRAKHIIFLFICAAVIIALVIALIVILLNKEVVEEITIEHRWPSPSNSLLLEFQKGAVAADNGICSEIGRDVLIKGGNAIDAAIATTICIGVFDAHSSGIGGGHFSTIYIKKDRRCFTVNARQTAPKAANESMFVGDAEGSLFGSRSIAVPGEVYGLWLQYKQFGGKLPWRDLLMPTANICRYGILISDALAVKLQENENYILSPDSHLKIFINPETNGAYKAGEVMRRPELADALEQLANAADPVQLFYNGTMAKDMVEEFKQMGGIITEEDMRNYRAKLSQPLQISIGENLIACGPPPPSSAAIPMAIMNIMDGFNVSPRDAESSESEALVLHRFLEAMKFSYAAHSQFGDADFVPEVLSLAKKILTKQYAQDVRKKITNRSHESSYYGELYTSRPNHGTAHISVLDAEGNAVSLTTTINTYFGSKVRSTKYDIIWNNDMDDFSTPGLTNFFEYPPLPNNFIKAGKRPLSSMSPLIFYDQTNGNVKLVVGAAGGSRIISTTAWVAFRSVFLNETIKEAVDRPRLHHQLSPNRAYYETLFPQVLTILLGFVDDLKNYGQNMVPTEPATAATGILVSDNGVISANSDWRKGGGYPAGY